MAKNFVIGRYIETHSIIHRLDSRIKLIHGMFFILLLMLANTWQQHFLLAIYTLIAIILTKISINTFLRGIRPILRIIIFTSVIQLLFAGGGQIFFRWGPVVISSLGIIRALNIFFRFSLVVVLTSIIALTTKPFDLTTGLTKLLKPLRLFKIKIDDFALMLAIALRFVPTLVDETTVLKRAHESRGIHFNNGNFIQRMKKIIPLLVPIYIRSFYRAEELANALDVKGYNTKNKRTQFRKAYLKPVDFLFVVILILIIALFTIF